MKPPFIRNPYNYDLEKASNEAAIPPDQHGISLTIQSQTEDADINVMMRRFGVTGQINTSVVLPEYGDYTGVSDYQSALHQVMEAQKQFLTLPPSIRSRYENNPQLFLDAVASGEALDGLREAGLIPTPTPDASKASSAS